MKIQTKSRTKQYGSNSRTQVNTFVYKQQKKLQPSFVSKIEDALPWWIPRVRIDIYWDTTTILGFSIIIFLLVTGFSLI